MDDVRDFFNDVRDEFEKIGDTLDVFSPFIKFFINIKDGYNQFIDAFQKWWSIACGTSSGVILCIVICSIAFQVLAFISFVRILKSDNV